MNLSQRKISTKKVVIMATTLLVAFSAHAQKYTVSGYVSDQTTKEILIDATSADSISGVGARSNNYGFYSLTLSKGDVSLVYSYMGYEPRNLAFKLLRDTTINVSLAPVVLGLEEVVISANDNNVKNVRPGQVFVPIATIRNTPSLFGESDLMKSLNYIPGVHSSTEGKADLSVRGGTPMRILFCLTGIQFITQTTCLVFFRSLIPTHSKM